MARSFLKIEEWMLHQFTSTLPLPGEPGEHPADETQEGISLILF